MHWILTDKGFERVPYKRHAGDIVWTKKVREHYMLLTAFWETANKMGPEPFIKRYQELHDRGLSKMQIINLMVAQGPDRKAGE